MAFSKSLPVGSRNFQASSLVSSRNVYYSDIDLSFETKEGVILRDEEGNAIGKLSGDVYKKQDVAAVTQALKTLLLTNQYEKPFQPSFGANLQRVLFDNVSSYTENDFADFIKTAIQQYEPRCAIHSIVTDLGPYGVNDYNINSISITIVFSVLNREERFTFTTVLNRLR
jgi:phage baseplate assembly protein W